MTSGVELRLGQTKLLHDVLGRRHPFSLCLASNKRQVSARAQPSDNPPT